MGSTESKPSIRKNDSSTSSFGRLSYPSPRYHENYPGCIKDLSRLRQKNRKADSGLTSLVRTSSLDLGRVAEEERTFLIGGGGSPKIRKMYVDEAAYGGGAFFIPYLLALFFVCIPLLLLEIALGQHLSTGDVGVFGSISPRLRGVGLISVLCGFIVTGYYVPLLAWISREFFESFGHVDWENITGADASDYFFNDIVGMDTLDDSLRPTRIVWENLFYLFFSWICIGGCVAFGIKWTGRILAYFTMGFPIFLLFVFFGRAVTLEGAEEGIYA
jgi:solute carrier family 6 GABA transporter-like protein 1